MPDKYEDILVDSALAKQLVPNKFKFTSKQGRTRRHKLLMAAKKLSETKSISEISLADVCEEANIPRASAYHFFPNVDAIFLALRFLNAVEIFEEVQRIEVSDYKNWKGYLAAVARKSADMFNEDITKSKIVFESNTPDFEGAAFADLIDGKIMKIIFKKLSSYYKIERFDNFDDVVLVAYGILNSVFMLSYRKNGYITDNMFEEAVTATTLYLRCYLPEYLPRLES